MSPRNTCIDHRAFRFRSLGAVPVRSAIGLALSVAFALVACSSTESSVAVSNGGAKGTGGAGTTTSAPLGAGGKLLGGATSGGAGGAAMSGAGGMAGAGGVAGFGDTASAGGASDKGGNTAGGGGSGAGGTAIDGGEGGKGGAKGGTSGSSDAGNATSDASDATSDVRDTAASETRGDAVDAATDARDASPADTNVKVTVYIAGDSTVSTYVNSAIHQGGWGQFLQTYFTGNATIVNQAVGGMTSRHFIEAGYLDQILATIKAGDYLLVQFGTNDGNTTATYTLPGSSTAIPYYLAPDTDFKTYLGKYVDATKAKSATTVFVTPPPRHSCNAGETGVRNGLASYATAMKELGATRGVPVVDLNAMTVAYLANVTCESSGSTFYLVKADGTTDSTHFQENGANVMAGLIAKGASGIRTLDLPLSSYVK